MVEGGPAVRAAHNCSSCLGLLWDSVWSGPRRLHSVCVCVWVRNTTWNSQTHILSLLLCLYTVYFLSSIWHSVHVMSACTVSRRCNLKYAIARIHLLSVCMCKAEANVRVLILSGAAGQRALWRDHSGISYSMLLLENVLFNQPHSVP